MIGLLMRAAACGPGPPRPDMLPVITDSIGSLTLETTIIQDADTRFLVVARPLGRCPRQNLPSLTIT